MNIWFGFGPCFWNNWQYCECSWPLLSLLAFWPHACLNSSTSIFKLSPPIHMSLLTYANTSVSKFIFLNTLKNISYGSEFLFGLIDVYMSEIRYVFNFGQFSVLPLHKKKRKLIFLIRNFLVNSTYFKNSEMRYLEFWNASSVGSCFEK